jgi:hypothetical protein
MHTGYPVCITSDANWIACVLGRERAFYDVKIYVGILKHIPIVSCPTKVVSEI